MDKNKAKLALAALQEKKRAQQYRLQLAAQAKRVLDESIDLNTQLTFSN